MNTSIDKKRILIYLAFAFGIAWLCALVIALTGGIQNSPVFFNFPGFTLALVLMAVVYMGAPAIAHVLTRWLTHEGWSDLKLRPRLKQGWPLWLAAWFLPGVMTIIGAAAYYLIFPARFDSSLTLVKNLASQAAASGAVISPVMLIAIQTAQAMLISPLVNGLFTFGEEFGWRAYLLPKLMPLGGRRAVLLSGIIWGLWHAPVIAMGHNYGFGYFGAPWTGILLMTVFTVASAAFLSWAVLRAGSVWPAVIGHAAMNGIGALGMLVLIGSPDTLLGPAPVGIIGMVAWLIVSALILLNPVALAPEEAA